MKTIFITICLIVFQGLIVSSQNKTVDEIGKNIFECVRDIDSIKLKKILPKREDLLGFISESSAANIDKQIFIDDVDTYFSDFENRIRRKLVRSNDQGINAGISWEKTFYLETIIKPKTSKNSITPINIDIKFSYYNTIYILRTKLIYYKNYYIADQITIEMI